MSETIGTMDAAELMSAVDDKLSWGPIRQDGLFFTQNAATKLKSADFDTKPYLLGSTSYDGTFFTKGQKYTHENFKQLVFGQIRNLA